MSLSRFQKHVFWTKLIPLESATQTMMYRGLIVEILYVSAILNKYVFSLLYSWCLLTVQQVTCFHITTNTIITSIIVRTKNDRNFITALWLASSAKRKLQFSEITWSVFLVIVDNTTASLYEWSLSVALPKFDVSYVTKCVENLILFGKFKSKPALPWKTPFCQARCATGLSTCKNVKRNSKSLNDEAFHLKTTIPMSDCRGQHTSSIISEMSLLISSCHCAFNWSLGNIMENMLFQNWNATASHHWKKPQKLTCEFRNNCL